jgi:MFS family permease
LQNGDRPTSEIADSRPWYAGITRYEWLVLIIASAGWVFDQYESQVFVLTKDRILPELSGAGPSALTGVGDTLFAIFLLGGTLGGLVAGSLADRYGRRPLLIATIVLYSIFSGLTFFITSWWQLAALRFLVAIGVGGEWAVAASLVAEVFPARARAYASGIFHASSVLGIWMATVAARAVGEHWRYAFLIGIIPSLLVVWVRARVREPEQWQAMAVDESHSPAEKQRAGSFRDLLTTYPWNKRALLGLALAAVGLATFWAVIVAGQDLTKALLVRTHAPADEIASRAQFAYGFVQTTGGGLGLLAFGPISARIGRRRAFIWFQLLALVIVPITCFAPQTYTQMLLFLPVFAFLTIAIHSGFAIYFPELFPTHLRATGASFCFNGGRLLAVPVLFASNWLKTQPDVDLRWAVTMLSSLFLLGIFIVLFLPETNRQELPE